LLDALAVQEIDLAPGVRHVEIFTMRGLVTILWHGPRDASHVVVAGGGAMGGLLGPANGMYQRLGEALAERAIGTLRVSYRRPNDLDECTIDMCATVDLAARAGARDAVTMGHSFGGAIAIRTACALGAAVKGVVTFATQSAGCEQAEELNGRPLLMFHGDRDELLPPQASEMVRYIAGTGELVVLPGEGHLLSGAGDVMLTRTLAFVDEVLT
ncbi:MAG TPA: dienelactone hydrolase family protein, partial [Acidimicrobiales bacterium]|nr:dienelactone hydrolase family protein [Acidimicrobiales bacterium]